MDYENLTPQYRIEEYLEAIVKGWAEATQYPYPDYPSWRLEEFLDAFITYIWEDGDHPRKPCPEPAWRLEECLRAIYDVMTGAATPWPFPLPTTNRIEEYLAAIHAYLADGTELPVPEPVWRIEQWLAYVLDAVKQGGGVATTVSGTMVHITNALAKAALSVLAHISPIQDLHGYSSPWPGGGGKNLLPLTVDGIKSENAGTWVDNTYSNNGVTFTILTDNSGNVIGIQASGTATGGNASLMLPLPINISVGDSVVLNGNPRQSTPATRIWVGTSQYADIAADIGLGTGTTFTYSESVARIWVQVMNNCTVDGVLYTPMIRLASVTDATFSPYSNICPISGRTGMSVYRTGKNLFDKSTPISRGQYVSGSWVDLDTRITTDFIPFVAETEYTMSIDLDNSEDLAFINFNYFDENKTWLGDRAANGDSSFSGQKTKTFTIHNPKAKFIRITCRAYSDTNLDISDKTLTNADLMLELGSTASTYSPYAGNTYAVGWTSQAGTVYGGTVDVVTGVLTIDRIGIDGGSIGWTKVTGNPYRNFSFTPSSLAKYEANRGTVISSQYKSEANNTAGASDDNYVWIRGSTINNTVCVKDTSKASLSASDFKTAMSGVQFCYELATPITYQLTAQEVQMLLGENYVWASSGDTVSVTYYAEGNANPLQSLNILLGGNYSNPKTADDVSDREALEIILGGNK